MFVSLSYVRFNSIDLIAMTPLVDLGAREFWWVAGGGGQVGDND